MSKINGIKVYDHLMSIKNKLDNEYADVLGEIAKVNNTINRSEALIDNNLKMISNIRLQEFSKEYTDLISPQEVQAFSLINDKRDEAIEIIKKENIKLAKEKETAEAELKINQDALNKLETKILVTKEKLEAGYDKDATLSTLIKQHKQSLGIINDYQEKIDALEKAKAKNIISFNNNEAFNYLYNRNFGKPTYNKNFLAKILDTKLAKSIGYDLKLTQYEALVLVPQQYAESIQTIKHEMSNVEPIINNTINKAEKESGLLDLLNEKATLKTSLNNSLDGLKSISGMISANIRTLKDFDANQDPLYQKATSLLHSYIEKMSLAELSTYVNSTTNDKDNLLYSEIEKAYREVKNQESIISKLNIDKETVSKKITSTKDVLKKMERENLNSKKVTYDSSVLNDMTLNNVLYTHLWWTTLNNDYSREVERSSNYDSYGSSRSNDSYSPSPRSNWNTSSSFDSSSNFTTTDSF